jgi:hypothetical protein
MTCTIVGTVPVLIFQGNLFLPQESSRRLERQSMHITTTISNYFEFLRPNNLSQLGKLILVTGLPLFASFSLRVFINDSLK